MAMILASYTLAFHAHVVAAESWTATTYFAPNFVPDFQLPIAAGDWKLYAQMNVVVGEKLTYFESAKGTDSKASVWLTHDYVVEIPATGTPSIIPRREKDFFYETPTQPDISWTKNLEPVSRLKQDKREILVFDRTPPEKGAYVQRIWISKDDSQVMAQVNGKFVTLLKKEKANAAKEPEMSERARSALKEYIDNTRKAEKYGGLP